MVGRIILVAAGGDGSGGHGLLPTPGHHVDGPTGGGAGKWAAGQQQQQQQQQQQHGQGWPGGHQQPNQDRGGGHAGENRGKGKKKRSKQDSRNNSGNGNHWDRVRHARFVAPEGHPAVLSRCTPLRDSPPTCVAYKA